MDGLAAGLGLVSEFSKVPVLGELVGGYVDIIKKLSPAIAKLKNLTREKLLDLTALTGELRGRL